MNIQCLLPSPALLSAFFSMKGSRVCIADSKISLIVLEDFFYPALTREKITRYFTVIEMAWIFSWKMFLNIIL